VFDAFRVGSAPDLCVRYLMPPSKTEDTLETFDVMSLQRFHMAEIECPALAAVEED